MTDKNHKERVPRCHPRQRGAERKGKFLEHPRRALVKALSYRVMGSLVTVGVVWTVSGRLDWAGITGAADAAVKIVAYYVHERLWARIPYGRVQPPEYQI